MEKKDVLAMLSYFDNVQKVTLKTIKLIPENKLDFKPCPEVMSIGELVRHIYINEKVCAEGAKKGVITEEDFKKAYCEIKEVKDLINLARKVHQSTNRIAKSLTPVQMKKKVKAFWGDQFPASLCFAMLYDEHWHHRGQLFTYLRFLGIKPPDLYGYK
ncbi:MAG: DinB family protein [Candidatus Zixiibacteriota bacterium]